MRLLRLTPAIVLRSWPYGESDKIVSFLTERHGKVTGIAKGAKRSRKRFVNTLEPFSLVNLRFQDRPHSSLAFVQACDLIRGFKELTTSLEKIAHASYLVEVTDGLTGERDENRSLFEHLREGLAFIEERGTSSSFLIFFELKLLQLSGYQPMLKRCRRCGRDWRGLRQKGTGAQAEGASPLAGRGTVPFGGQSPAKWRFSPRDGGILCESCSTFRKEAMPLSFEAIDALTDIQSSNGILAHHLSLPPRVLKESRSVLLRFIQFQINRELKSAPFLDAFCFA